MFWYLYREYIFIRTSKPKIKLQKGVQYGTFKCMALMLFHSIDSWPMGSWSSLALYRNHSSQGSIYWFWHVGNTLHNNSEANPHVTLAQGIDHLSWSWEMQKKPKHTIQNFVCVCLNWPALPTERHHNYFEIFKLVAASCPKSWLIDLRAQRTHVLRFELSKRNTEKKIYEQTWLHALWDWINWSTQIKKLVRF